MSRKSGRKSTRLEKPKKEEVTPKARAEEKVAVGVEVHQSYSGPIPDPQTLLAYNQVVPGAAQKIFDAFLSQSSHRQELEKLVIANDIRRSREGLWLGFILAVTVTLTGAYVVATSTTNAQAVAGGVIATTGVGSLVGCFIYGTNSRRKERKDKSEFATQGK